MREELQQRDVERWLGFITFLCEVFGTMRSSTGEPFRVLVCPIYTCLREVMPHFFTRAWTRLLSWDSVGNLGYSFLSVITSFTSEHVFGKVYKHILILLPSFPFSQMGG